MNAMVDMPFKMPCLTNNTVFGFINANDKNLTNWTLEEKINLVPTEIAQKKTTYDWLLQKCDIAY